MPEDKNIWQDNMDVKSPPIEYKDLVSIIGFEGFRYEHYQVDEEMVLQPRMENLGYSHIKWLPGETDSFGPLSRVCMARNRNGEVVWFVYG